MKINRLIFFILGVVLTTPFLYAADGGEEGAFLKRGMGARALALGKSYVAIADDSTAVYWNPAGLTQIEGPEISLMYSEPYLRMVKGIGYHTLSFVKPIGKDTFGIGIVSLGVDGLEKYSESGEYEGTFQNVEEAVFFSYSHQLRDRFSLGASLKYLHQKLDTYAGTGYGLDIGGLYRPHPNLKFGLMLQDLIGPTLDLARGGEPFPLKTHLGMSYRISGPRWLDQSGILFTLGAVGTDGRSIKLRGGLEFQIIRSLAVRGGYDGGSGEIGVGVGVGLESVWMDYNYATHRLLQETHQVSLSIRY